MFEKLFRKDSKSTDLEDRPTRRMDRLRRSLRSSLRRKKDHHSSSRDPHNSTVPPPSSRIPSSSGRRDDHSSSSSNRQHQWQADEVAVRSGTCSFQVKYLGCIEVFESRGMQVCEEAITALKRSKRKSVRAVLYVHGDGLRVVDNDTKGLIVDQTIEKVSFCAPDRNYERGFAYICRDGTTRRWMCHGFMAVRESGERLSHAVGCAFAICLEKKQQRDRLCSVSMSVDASNSAFTRHGSFRQASLTERLADPQGIKPSNEPPPQPDQPVDNPFAVARPHATDLMLQRQTSFRGFNQLQAANSPFKRQLSLKLNELPSTLERQNQSASSSLNNSNDESKEDGEPVNDRDDAGIKNAAFDSILMPSLAAAKGDTPSQVQLLKSHLSQLYQISDAQQKQTQKSVEASFQEPKFDAIAEDDETETADSQDPISSMCQQLSQELSALSNKEEKKEVEENEVDKKSLTINTNSRSNNVDGYSASCSPSPSSSASSSPPSMSSPKPVEVSPKPDPLANVKPVQYDNPWDFVPDQPNRSVSANNNPTATANISIGSNCDSSSGISSCTSASSKQQQQQQKVITSAATFPSDDWPSSTAYNGGGDLSVPSKSKWVDDFEVSSNKERRGNEFWSLDGSGILDDPFDAEWAALAARNAAKNPFVNGGGGEGEAKAQKETFQTAFELSM